MGTQLSICSKKRESHETSDTNSLFTKSDEEYLLSKFHEISNSLSSTDHEKEVVPFQFIYNYYLAASASRTFCFAASETFQNQP